VLTHALRGDPWQAREPLTRSQRLAVGHAGLAHRWVVVSSQAAWERAERTVTNASQRASATIAQQRFHLPAKRFEPPEAAHAALAPREQSWRSQQGETTTWRAHKRYAGKGRPTSTTPLKATTWQMQAQGRPDNEQMRHRPPPNTCFVLEPNSAVRPWSAPELMAADKAQAHAEGGCRFLKAPLVFVSSWVVKQPARMPGVLRGMTLAVLVSSVAQRRLRQQWARQGETVPHQINQPTVWPPWRWVFQLLEGMAARPRDRARQVARPH
jgi:transposase